MYVYWSPFCDCVHGKGQHQLGQGEKSFKEVLFSQPSEQTWLMTHHWLSCSQIYPRTLRLGWETMKRYPRTIPGPFSSTANLTSNVGEITKFPPIRTHCFFVWELEGTGADTGNAVLHLLSTAITNLRIILQSYTAIRLDYRVCYDPTL